MIDLKNLTIKKVRASLDSGEYSAVDLAQAYLDNIANRNDELNAYLEVYEDVLEQAMQADERIKNGDVSELTGIPIAIKDNILIKGRIASSASLMLENYTATYDAHIIERLKKEGAVFLGRVNMDEFAMGASTENSAFGGVKNPADATRVPGGSSGGSAVAVASNMALVSLGSDTGGSIRQPAGFCGVVGLKPTYGAVSRRGLMAMASSFDQIGPIGKSTEDVKALFNCLEGYDVKDSTSVSEEEKERLSARSTKSEKMIIGIPEDFVSMDGVDSDVLENFRNTVKKLEGKGYEIKNVSLPNLKYSLAVYYIIMPAEASTNLSRFDGVRYGLCISGKNGIEDYAKTRGAGFGKEVRRRIMLGAYVLSAGYKDAYYNKAVAVKELIKEDYRKAFEGVDVIVTPTSPTPAFKFGEKSDNPLQMYLADIFTVSLNIAGVPGISIPSGFVDREDKKLPVGFQIIAPHFCEESLFDLGKDVEGVVNQE